MSRPDAAGQTSHNPVGQSIVFALGWWALASY